jgi:hypothetical protein
MGYKRVVWASFFVGFSQLVGILTVNGTKRLFLFR